MRALKQTRTVKMLKASSTTRMARRLAEVRARGSHRREKALTQAPQEETKDRHGQLIETTLDLHLLRPARQLHLTRIHTHTHTLRWETPRPMKCHTTRVLAHGRRITLAQQESGLPCSRVLAGLRVFETRPQDQIEQTLVQMLAHSQIQVAGNSGTRTPVLQTSRSLTCMPTRATRSRRQRSSEAPTSTKISLPQRIHSLLHLLQHGLRVDLQPLRSSRPTA
jgi:hypothetical protein